MATEGDGPLNTLLRSEVLTDRVYMDEYNQEMLSRLTEIARL